MQLEPYNKIFQNTQNSYKFFWWLAILEIVVEKQVSEIYFEDIVIKIICKLWYPVNFYKLSFGKLDKCAAYITKIKTQFDIPEDLDEKDLLFFLSKHKNSILIKKISSELTRYVPYRFIRPWYAIETRSITDNLVNQKIVDLQNADSPYIIDNKVSKIILEDETVEWIFSNYKLLEAHVYFELLKFLEKNNLNVSNLSIKLFKPRHRNLFIPTKLWSGYIQVSQRHDIFEKKLLQDISSMSIDHFLPWSFVAHDHIWNLHPIEKSVNSMKSNFIPNRTYLASFSSLQYSFSRYLIKINQKNAIENYILLFKCSSEEFLKFQEYQFQELMKEFYLPQIEIANNMGFSSDWILN